jgi:hypothetical protein
MEHPGGIFEMLEPLQRARIKRLLPVGFEDIYDSIETMRDEVRGLEAYLDRLFTGMDGLSSTAEGPKDLPC